MIIKHRPLSRPGFAALALAMAGAVLLAGCKKDHREKIDLSNIHTTAAEEMAVPVASQAVTEAATEAFGTSSFGSSPGGGQNGQTASSKNISTEIHTYTSGKVSIEYPSVINLGDSGKKAAIDALMKDNALSILSAYRLDETQDTLSIQCRVLSADRSRITAVYTGTCQAQGAAYPTNLFYSNTIDVEKEDNIGFGKFADPYTMAGYVLSEDCEFYHAAPELAAELMDYKNSASLESYTNLFTHADFPVRGTFPESFSYEHEGTIFFSIPVPHALGDYAIVAYTPDTK